MRFVSSNSSSPKSPESRPLWMRILATGMLAWMLFVMVGAPLPNFARKQTDERFPCENSPCGCSTAAQCWNSCCCHSDEQKLEWAEKNAVEPPTFLVKRVAAKKFATQAPAVCAQPSSLGGKRACCSRCEPKEIVLVGSESGSKVTSKRPILALSALKCRGLHIAFLMLKSTLVVEQYIWRTCGSVPTFAVELQDHHGTAIFPELDDPVPRTI